MKKWIKAVAVTLAAMLVIQTLPLSVMAEEATKAKKQEYTTENGESVIIEEVEEERGKYTKVYRRADGTLTELRSAEAIHFKQDGKWEEIDNTLTDDKNEDGDAVLRNQANSFEIQLPRTMGAEKEVEIEKDGKTVAFSPSDDLVEKTAGAQIEKIEEVAGQSEAEKAASISKTQTKVTYEKVKQNTDLEYIVQPDGVKENIVVSEKPSVPSIYEFKVRLENLEAQLQEDNSIIFTDADGAAVFIIPAPVMYDAKYSVSTQIDVSFTSNAQGDYVLRYAPSMEWMNDSKRVYPVKVDPVIRVANGSGSLKDTTISEPDSVNDNMSTIPFCAVSTYRKDDCDHASTLYDFRGILPTSGHLKVITNAVLKLNAGSLYGSNCVVTAHRITSDWNASTVTYNTKPSFDEKVLDYFTATSESGIYTLDLTEIMNGWRTDAYPNYGIQLNTTENDAVLIYSNESAAATAPMLEITYREMNGIDGISPTHTMYAEDAGIVYWNDLNSVVGIQREDLSLPGNIMPVSIKRVYRSMESELINPYGTGWVINYAQKLSYSGGSFRYLDEKGGVRYFNKSEDLTEDGRECWTEESCGLFGISGTKLCIDKGNTNYKSYTGMSLEKSDGTSLRFDSGGRLVTITDSSKNKNKITITYSGSGIDTITDGVGRQYKFLYQASVMGEVASLQSIECRDSAGTPITIQTDDGQTIPIRVDYTYKKINGLDKRLIKISRPSGKSVEYNYGEDKLVLKNSSNGLVECSLSPNGRCEKLVKKVWDENTSSYLLHSSLEMESNGSSQRIFTDHTGVAEIIQYDTAGRVVSRRMKSGAAEFSSYGADGTELVSPSMSSEDTATRNNYIKNGDFSQKGTLSSAENWSWNILQGGGRTTIQHDDTRDPELDDATYYMNGTARKLVTTTQTVQIDGKKGENFTIAGWGKGVDAVPTANDKERFFGLKVEAKKSDGNYEELKKVEFVHGINGWQYYGDTFSLDRDITEVRVSLCYHKEYGKAYFDGIQLYKEDWTSVKGQGPGTDTGDQENLCPCSKCNEPNCTCHCASEAACTCAQCKRYTDLTTNNNGQITNTVMTDGVKSIVSKNTFTANGNYLSSTKVSGQEPINYSYNEMNGLLKSKNGEQYEYNANGTLSRVSQEIGNRQVMENQYIYEGNALKKIIHNGFPYNLKQNAFGSLTQLKIGEQEYVANEYSNNSTQQLLNTTFGNGQKLSYTYDGQNNMTGVSHDGGLTQRFQYAYDGYNLKSTYDLQTGIKTEYIKNGLKKWNTKTQEQVYLQGQDNAGNETECVIGNANYTYVRSDAKRNAATGKTSNSYSLNGNPFKLNFNSTTDYFGRQESKMANVSLNGMLNFIQTTKIKYREVAGTGETTSQISSYQQSSLSMGAINNMNNYEYTYNSKGDIKTISKNGTLVSTYYYDQAGQLTQEINNEKGTVCVYHYDAGGNLTHRSSGAYDPNHITQLFTDRTYTYGDANWKDKLTGFNGKAITYDAIGNPLTYDGWVFTWEAGRQLKNQVKGNTKIEYVYDENGLRTQKKVTENEKTTVYDYVWKNDKLLGLTISAPTETNHLYFIYDEDGKVAGFIYNNKDIYFYQVDAQGNVNGIINQSGTKVAEYTYDVWGQLQSATGEMAQINPINYRGYLYDHETGFYYLQSRYYNPEWGRFINADTIPDNEYITGLNLFSYCLNNPVRFIDVKGEAAMDPGAVMVAGAIVALMFYAYDSFIGDFMLKNSEVHGTNVQITLEGNESFLEQLLYVNGNLLGRPPTSIDALILAIPEFEVMSWWVGLFYLLHNNEFIPLSNSVIVREIAVHVFGYFYMSWISSIRRKCRVIDIDPTTDRFLENYIFGYKWPKWLQGK